MVLAKSLYVTRDNVICEGSDVEAHTCWGHAGMVLADDVVEALGLRGGEYDAGNVLPAGGMEFKVGSIPIQDKAVRGPKEPKKPDSEPEPKAKLSGVERPKK